MKPIAVLIGPPAAGKTKLGKRVARALGVGFIDTDARIVDAHGPITEIFQRDGEQQFRAWERRAVIDALSSDGIVSLGGGAILDTDTQTDLSNHRVVLVTVNADAVADRLESSARPLLAGGLESWTSLVATRQPIYDTLADIIVDTSVGPMESHANALAERLRDVS